MKRYLPVILFLVTFLCPTPNSFAQNSDFNKLNTTVPKTFYKMLSRSLDLRNPNHKTMEYIFRDQVVDVSPNFRVHPSYERQFNVPIARGLDPNILFASASVYNPGSLNFTEGVYVSTDGGNNWFGSDTCSSPVISNHNGNPGPGVGPDSRLYLSYFYNSYSTIRVSYSTDYGATWSAGTSLQSGSTFNYNKTAVDNLPASPYFGRAYVAWMDYSIVPAGIAVSYSTNGGVNWSAHQDINTESSGHFFHSMSPAVGPDGSVYIAYQNELTGSSHTGDFIGLAKSTDGGVTWTYNNDVYDCNGVTAFIPFIDSDPILIYDFPSMAIDNSGGPRNGWIYIVTAEKFLAPAGTDLDIIMHVSSDGGSTWSSGIRVNQDPVNNGQYQYTPAVCVGEDGAVNVVYYDTRNATIIGGIPDSAQVYISRSTDGGTSFEDVPVSDHRFQPKPIQELGAGQQGDYIGIVESNGTVFPYWCDDFTGIYQAWTTKVTFSPLCPVETAANPNPPDGTINVDINLSQLTWSNGTGANTNELYFGTDPSSLSLVQSGSLATYWTIDPGYLPLDYYTNYYWKVVETGDTCNSEITFRFRTEHAPNSQPGSDTLYPQSAQFWTGTTEGTVKIDGGINAVYHNVGWAVFDISSIPANAVVNGVTFRGFVSYTNFPFWSATPMGSLNPVSDNAAAIKDQILASYNQNIAYIYSDETVNFMTGWHEYPMDNSAVPDIQNAVTSSQGWFAIGIVDRDFSEFYQINFEGWSDPNPPNIIVDYEVTPVELISFKANVIEGNVSLNWQTATETNNKGFEVERSSTSEVSGQTGWKKIGYVGGNGTSTETHLYSYTDKDVIPGKYSYRLKQIDFDGKSEYSKEVEVDVNAPAVFVLQQNYPNPFNPTTMIKYSIPLDQHVRLNVFNLLGQKVITLLDGMQKAGQHEVNFNASNLASGIYFYKLEAGNQSSIKKLILMK